MTHGTNILCMLIPLLTSVTPEAIIGDGYAPVIIREFSSVSIVCDVTGVPAPNVTWTFGNTSVVSGTDFTLSRMETLSSENYNVTSTLTVLNASRSDLVTLVSCEAANGDVSNISAYTVLLVICE